MNNFLKGITYAYNRNIGWQDKAIRSVLGFAAFIGSVYFFMDSNLPLSITLGIFVFAQIGTVLSSKCIICYFSGLCSIGGREKKALESKGILYEKYNS